MPTRSQTDYVQLIERTCTPCHNEKENPGITFKSLKDIYDRRAMVEYLIKENIMPKTHSDPTYRTFANEIYLSNEEKENLLKFLNSNRSPKNYKFNYSSAHNYQSTKSLVFKTDVVLQGINDDTYAIIKIPYEAPKDSLWITGYKVRTSSPKDFHHIGLFFLRKDQRNKNLSEGLRVFYHGSQLTQSQVDTLERIYQLMELIPMGERFFWDWMVFKTEWQIGGNAFLFPEGSGFILPRSGALLLNNVHLRPSPMGKKLQITLELFYDEKPPPNSKYLYVVDIANVPGARLNPPLKIPAGKKQSHVLSCTLPGDMLLHAVSPHMHYLGKKFEAFVVSPNGDTTRIIRINNWDPDWMKTYQYEKPLLLEKNSVFYCIGYYDNTAENPRNPNIPPRDVGNSMVFREEMLNMIIYFTEP